LRRKKVCCEEGRREDRREDGREVCKREKGGGVVEWEKEQKV